MSIHHHLDDATIMRYASGDLDPAFCVIVAAHLAMCEKCREAVRVAEAVGGEFLEHSAHAPVSDGAFDRITRTLDAETTLETAKPAMVSEAVLADQSDVPLPLRSLIGESLDDVGWQWLAPGVQRHRIELVSTDSSLFMLKIGPGRKMPEHGHGGSEMTLVLKGSYKDSIGRFGPGDIADLDEHDEHQPAVDSSEPCICLVATEEPTQFKGIVSRLMQPLVRI